MAYIFGILILMVIFGWIWRKVSNRVAKKRHDYNNHIHTKEQIDYLNGKDNEVKMDYRGRKTKSDWLMWYEDELSKNN